MSLNDEEHFSSFDIFCIPHQFVMTLFLVIQCKARQVEPFYIDSGNGAAAMQVSQVNLFELGPTCCGNASKSSELV